MISFKGWLTKNLLSCDIKIINAMMKDLDSLQLTVPNDLQYFDIAQLFVRDVAKKIGFTGKELNQIDIAIEEAVTNVMKYAYDKEESKTIDVVCQKIEGGIKIIIKDMGIPFDPNRIARFNITKDINDLSTEGLGIFMIQKMVDDLSFHNMGHMGKETHMVKYLPRFSQPLAVDETLSETIEDIKVVEGTIDFTVKAMKPEEAIEVSRCAYKSHGFSFFDDHIYYPERLVEMNKTGQMVSGVAVTSENDFMGHAALLFQYPEDTIAELTFAFVNVEYRGHGALNRLNEYLFNVPTKRKLTGIYAYAVANHIFTQKSFIKNNIKECGILLATSPATWKFKGISDDTSQRISVVIGFKYMTEPIGQILYPPRHHREMIGKLYDHTGAVHQFKEPDESGLHFTTKETRLEDDINALEGCGEIYVMEYGENAINEVRKMLRRHCIKQVAAINLFLKLTDPLTFHLTAEFEKMGFFFAGILPGTRIGDTLVLQYLNNVEFDYDKVVIYSDITREIFNYIRRHDPNEAIGI
jgi:anti-sigma regulatory factor (Ser/Thr protein kinase)